jgi:hypothetical protein
VPVTELLSRGDALLADRPLVRRDITTIYHPVGTCAMGGDSRLAASKLTSVVDGPAGEPGSSGTGRLKDGQRHCERDGHRVGQAPDARGERGCVRAPGTRPHRDRRAAGLVIERQHHPVLTSIGKR